MGLGDGCSDYPSVSASSTLDDGSTGSGLIAVAPSFVGATLMKIVLMLLMMTNQAVIVCVCVSYDGRDKGLWWF